MQPSHPIGVFDSGVGGLTVLNALKQQLPQESFLYLGDTARLPYGTKSEATVIQYALSACQALVDRGVKAIVVACNTASALALPALVARFAPLPVIGVVEPGAGHACQVSKTGQISVIATEQTVAHRAYEKAIHAQRPDANVVSQSCSLFVALAEEGWAQGPIAEAVAAEYLKPLFANHVSDCLVLGCTHFPLLTPAIQQVIGHDIKLVDSASSTATVVKQRLASHALLSPSKQTETTYFITDCPKRFLRVAPYFLQHALDPQWVEVIDLPKA